MRTLFSPANAFRRGQSVTVGAQTGIALGWMPGTGGKHIAVKVTSGKGRGKVRAFRPSAVLARKGKRGAGPLPRFN